MSGFVSIDGTKKKVVKVFANVEGKKREIKSAWINRNGVPTKVYENTRLEECAFFVKGNSIWLLRNKIAKRIYTNGVNLDLNANAKKNLLTVVAFENSFLIENPARTTAGSTVYETQDFVTLTPSAKVSALRTSSSLDGTHNVVPTLYEKEVYFRGVGMGNANASVWKGTDGGQVTNVNFSMPGSFAIADKYLLRSSSTTVGSYTYDLIDLHTSKITTLNRIGSESAQPQPVRKSFFKWDETYYLVASVSGVYWLYSTTTPEVASSWTKALSTSLGGYEVARASWTTEKYFCYIQGSAINAITLTVYDNSLNKILEKSLPIAELGLTVKASVQNTICCIGDLVYMWFEDSDSAEQGKQEHVLVYDIANDTLELMCSQYCYVSVSNSGYASSYLGNIVNGFVDAQVLDTLVSV